MNYKDTLIMKVIVILTVLIAYCYSAAIKESQATAIINGNYSTLHLQNEHNY